MGVGQSRELLGKVGEEHVFVCTNYEELLETLKKLQRGVEPRSSEALAKTNESLLSTGNGDVQTAYDVTIGPSSNRASRMLLGSGVNRGSLRFLSPSLLENSIAKPLEIHIPNHYMGDAGLITGHEAALATLANSPGLRSLDISYNSLTSVCIEALLGKNVKDGDGTSSCFLPPNLLSLNFAGNRAGRAGCELLGEFLAKDPPLRALSLYNNDLYDDDVKPLLHGLRSNTRLRQLNLDFNHLTGGFVEQLRDLLQVNKTLAVVMFDGPYDMSTFVRLKELKPAEVAPDKCKDPPGHARALLRAELLCRDLAGRQPFPADLTQEVEVTLRSRRVRYVEELRKEREEAQKEAQAIREKLELARRCRDVSCCTYEVEETNAADQEEGGDDNGSKSGSETHGPQEEHDEEEEREAQKEKDEVETSTKEVSFSFLPPLRSNEGQAGGSCSTLVAAPVSCLRPKLGGIECKRQSTTFFPGLVVCAADVDVSQSSSLVSGSDPKGKDPTSEGSVVEGSTRVASTARSYAPHRKELTNGFDRLFLVQPSDSHRSKTVWKTVTGPPCRLRACWCDARADIVPYANVLHYHCKHEQLTNEAGYEMPPPQPNVGNASGCRERRSKVLLKGRKTNAAESLRLARTAARSQGGKDGATPPAGGFGAGKTVSRYVYEGCKATSHRCESIGFYGKPKPDRRSVVFFSGQHPMLARGLQE